MDAEYFTPAHSVANRPRHRLVFLAVCLAAITFAHHSTALAARRTPATSDNASVSQSGTATASDHDTTATSPPAQPQTTPTVKSGHTKSTATKSTTAKPDAAKSDAKILSAEAIASQIKDLESATDADQPNRAALLDLYRQALDDLKQVDDQKSRIAELEKQRIATPYQLELRKRDSAAKPAAKPAPVATLPAGAALDDWEQQLAAAQSDLQAAQKTADDLESQQQQRAAHRLEIPQAIAAARIKLDELEQSRSIGTASADNSGAMLQAQSVSRQTHRLALQTEIALAEKELQTFDSAAAELLTLDREAADAKASQLQTKVAIWQDAVNHRREQEADQQASEARLAAVTALPAIRELADANSQLASRRAELTKVIEQLATQRNSVVARLDKVSDQFKQASDKLTATGLTEAVGQMLLKQRSELAAIDADRRAAKLRQAEIARVQVELFEFQEQLADLHNLDASVEEFRAALPAAAQVNPADLRQLLQTKRKYLDALIEDENSYFSALVDVDSNQRELLTQADAFRDYIEQRVLWVRSTHPLSFADAGKAASAAAWLVRPGNWWSAICELVAAARDHAALVFLAAMLFVAWALSQHRLRVAIRQSGDIATPTDVNSPSSSLRRACQSAAITFLIAAFWPALCWCLGWLLLGNSAANGEFPEALGRALQLTAVALLPVLLIRQICRHDGLAEVHFLWPRYLLLPLRRHITRLAMFGAPVLLLITILQFQSTAAWKESLGRLAFIAGQLVVAGFVFAVLRPPRGPLHRLMVLRSDTWTSTLSLPAFLVLLTFPLILAVLSAAGYHYTSLRLSSRLQTTLWLILGLVIAQSLISIWLTTLYRRLAVKTATRLARSPKRFAGFTPSALAPASAPPAETHPLEAITAEIDVEKVDAQTQGLLHNLTALALAVGLCLIWLDMFPALQFFNQIIVWGDSGTGNSITLGNLLEAAVVAALTLVAAKNLPSLLDLAFLQHLMPDRGSRYALVAVIRYSIVVVGIAAAGETVGIGWSKLQWLIAAMSFGLGFGLQEIFANFVSGLIVLFERPIRVGDTVTVGDVTGVVSRIKMRATTIVDADRKELILPNKDLVSGRLVNWTLSDSVVRLVVRLGIAYGSDTAQAQRLLLDVASKTPEVLKTPPSKAVFMGFGEKSLDFELRVFVGSVDAMLSVRHQLNMAIDRTFHAAGVEIAFAQADTYVRSHDGAQHQPNVTSTEISALSPQDASKAA